MLHHECVLGELASAWRYSANLELSPLHSTPTTTMTTTSGTSLDSDFERLLSSSPTTVRTLSWREKMALKDDTVDTEPGRPNIVTFDVAGRLFKVSTDILIANSGWFQLRLSPHYNWTPQRDGTYFIDTDPDLFTHLLAYMRRPEVFPLFYSKTDGFDYNVYNRLEVEATYFQIDALHEWIAAKKYLKAFRVHTHSSVTRDLHNIDQEGFVSDISEERYVVSPSSTSNASHCTDACL